DDVSAVDLPAAIEAKAEDFSYQARWSAEGRHLQVRTEIVSTVPTRVCSPEQIEAVRAAYRSIEDRVGPLLHFSRMNGAGDDVHHVGEGSPITGAEPEASSPHRGNSAPATGNRSQ